MLPEFLLRSRVLSRQIEERDVVGALAQMMGLRLVDLLAAQWVGPLDLSVDSLAVHLVGRSAAL
jgi:hypothetical protein